MEIKIIGTPNEIADCLNALASNQGSGNNAKAIARMIYSELSSDIEETVKNSCLNGNSTN